MTETTGRGESALALFERPVPFLDEFAILPEERGLRSSALDGMDFDEQGFELVARLVTELAITVLAEVFELLAAAFPPVAVFVVLARLRAPDRDAARNTGDRLVLPGAPGPPHTTAFGSRALTSSRRHAAVSASCPHRWRTIYPRRWVREGMQVRSRHHLRSDAVDEIERTLADRLGVDLAGDTYERVEFAESDRDLVLVDGDPLVIYLDDDPFLTVRGANAHPPETGVVTVDTGAISFVSDGADVMRPGITEADPGIEAGQHVVIAEEAHGKALAIGCALVDGTGMTGDSGKVVESVHHVGDDLYEFSI